ncbi:Prefoldin subunit 4 [Paramicrosporidium saccamoebae]|uniref:Prefoldin subunit 4 n=1 Tax=Paramicrosporidium saccamoebae TaxID=1246581 RepID=A0A2H9TN29_9FUNG|nr:Prefoldin subunit 4 [Paramicrosporidium saccamoebae]
MAKEQLNVSWEDQKRINEFAVLVQRLDRVRVEFAKTTVSSAMWLIRIRCGSGFASAAYDDVVNSLNQEQESRQRRLADLRAEISQNEERSAILKNVLQSKFGDAIQLDLE